MRRDKNKKEEVDTSAPAWMVTYGDMMTLLLCFFVLLFSFSVIDAARFDVVMQALKAKLGVLDGGRTISESSMINSGLDSNQLTESQINNNEFEEIRKQVESYIEKANLQDNVKLEDEARGLVIRLTGQVLFDLGKADIKPEGHKVLREIATFLVDIPNYIMVEGHTDNWPISTVEFPNNWVLSSVRATNVIVSLTDNTKIDPRRLSINAFGEYRPLVPNDSSENRANNRRVDIVITRYLFNPDNVGGGGIR